MNTDWKNKKRHVTICIVLSISLLLQFPCSLAVGQAAASTQLKAAATASQEQTVRLSNASTGPKAQKTLGNVTFAIQNMYYDGHVAMLTMQRTASQPDAMIVDEVFRDSKDSNPLYEGEEETGIPTYCDISFYTKIDGEKPDYLGASGGGMNSGNPLDSYGLLSYIPLDVSPASVKAVITMATLTPQLDTDKEMDSITVDIPKTDKPLVDADLDLDMGPTVVKHIVISRTPLLLVVLVYHQPAEATGDHSFSVYPCGGAALKDDSSTIEDLDEKGWVCVERTFSLSMDDPLPEALQLHYNGGAAKDLKVNLSTATVEMLGS